MAIHSLKPVHQKGAWFYREVWDVFGRRRYGRNINDPDEIIRGFVALFFVVLATLFFKYFPFHISAAIVFVPVLLLAMFRPVHTANKTPWVGLINILIGLVGLLTHWQFGLTLFSYHVEFVLFWGFLVGGVLSVYRRAWNALIWTWLDKSGRVGVVY